jgi:Septum formation/Domain of unknown function (DUF4190)
MQDQPAPPPLAAEHPSPYLRPTDRAPSYGGPTYAQPVYPSTTYEAPAPYSTVGAYGYGYPTYVPVEAAVSRRTDPVSVAALVCGCLLLAPLAVVLGIIGIVRTRRPDRGGRGLAIAGLVLGAVGVLIGAGVIASVLFARSDTGHEVIGLATGDTVYVGDLAEGDCFQAPTADLLKTVDTVDCTTPHDLEVYVVGPGQFADLGARAPYPGETTLSKEAAATCQQAFEGFVGTPYDESELDFYTIYPSRETWENEQDRAVTCSVGNPEARTTGTLEGARR